MKTRIIQDDPGDGESTDGEASQPEDNAGAAASGESAEDSGRILAKVHGRGLRDNRHMPDDGQQTTRRRRG
jgi:hypothetical protein